MDVVMLRWPAEAATRTELVVEGKPRLLLIEGDVPPPLPEDCLEDWIRVPADDGDVVARVRALGMRLGSHQPVEPTLDPDGVLRYGADWVSLPPVEARLMAELVERFGAVVSRDHLGRVGWPGLTPDRNVLDVHILRLRRRIAPLGLAIRTVRSRGYLLEQDPAGTAATNDTFRSDTRQEAVRSA